MNNTSIKDINNDVLHHEIMIRTKDVNSMKQYFFPTQIFFNEDTNFLFKNNINIIKVEKFCVEEITKNFIGGYSLSYNTIIYEFIKKMVELFEEDYRKKIQKYKKHCEIKTFYEMIIKNEYYRKELIKNEIELHEE